MLLSARVLATLAALFASSAAQAADQFDLLCIGQEQFYPGMKPIAISHHYRIDLAAKRWCWEQCTSANNIQSITPDRITFYDNSPTRPMLQAYVSRTDGKYYRYGFGRSFTHDEGTCEPVPFTGLPTPKF